MKTIIVTDQPTLCNFVTKDNNIVTAADYLINAELTNGEPLRVINLCQSYQYQTTGYYVSLLAEARGHKVFPSVLTIQDVKTKTTQAMINATIREEMQEILRTIRSEQFVLSIYFGQNMAKRYANFSRKLHSLFPLPMFRVFFKFKEHWSIQKITPISLAEVPRAHQEFLSNAIQDYLAKKRFYLPRKKNIYYDLAILHNPSELTPPSKNNAIKKFIAAGSHLGINVELIEKDDFRILNEYDALFIRETTAVNHHTYQFAHRAMAERLVVIDDPISILKCTNKVYLAELLQKHHIKAPKTTILSKYNWKEKKSELSFPCVLKQPDSSFSQGVVKVNHEEEFVHAVKTFFKASDLIIAQAFVPSEFDWRIGIINHQPLYACRYYMAKDHWQIYNWSSTEEKEGNFDAVPLDLVPKSVLNTALKATKLIGDGLYGVDLKEIGENVYVIEVNDNPNIDHGIEDVILEDELYIRVMKIFLERIKKNHGYT